MLLVSQSSRNQRKSILSFVPKIGLSIVDYGRLDEIDNFYIDCQNVRDYYRDSYNKLPRPQVFKKHYGKCVGNRFKDNRSSQMLQPVIWQGEKQPVIYPVNYGRNLVYNEGIQLGGRYDPASCIKYKR